MSSLIHTIRDQSQEIFRQVEVSFSQMTKKNALVNKKAGFVTVVYIDAKAKLIHIAGMKDGNASTVKTTAHAFKAVPFSEEFFNFFSKTLADYSAKYPSAQNADTVIVLPDELVTVDVVALPTLSRQKMYQSLDVLLKDLYRHIRIRYNRAILSQNRQFSTFTVAMMKQEILSSIYASCAGCKMTPRLVTFAAASAVNAVQAVNSKLKTASYVLMNIRTNGTFLSFVNHGRTVAYAKLPFGMGFLGKNRLVSEDMLFDYSISELLVVNANEKARAKQLSTLQGDNAAQFASGLGDGQTAPDLMAEYESAFAPPQPVVPDTIKVLPKKTPRKLPRFMMRPEPTDEQEIACENFRVFVKWVLNFIAENENLYPDGVKNVYVEMPGDYDFVLDKANAESGDNGVRFHPLHVGDKGSEIMKNLVLYGGFIGNPYNDTCNF